MEPKAKQVYRYVVAIHRQDAPWSIAHTIQVNGFNDRDARQQARSYLKSLTYSLSKGRP